MNTRNEDTTSTSQHSADGVQKISSEEIDKISTCLGLGFILQNSDQKEHKGIYDALGKRLFDIIKDIFDMRDIPKEFHLQIFQQLGYKYVATLMNCPYYSIIRTISTLPEHERLSFLRIVGFDKVRSFIHGEERVKEFFNVMPHETHDFLKKILFLYDIKITCNGSRPALSRAKKDTEYLDLSESKTEYCRIENPIQITDEIVFGQGVLKKNYRCHYVIYNTLQDSIEGVADKFFDLMQLIDDNKKIFVAHEWGTNHYYQLSWINGNFMHTDTAYADWHSTDMPYERELFNDIIPLPNGKWMILSQEDNNVINIYKGWYIDILDPETFRLSRMLNVHRDQYEFMDHLTLMPDGRTVLTWSDHTVKPEVEGCCLTTYSICLINTDDYSVQRLILPIDPRAVEGNIKHVNVQDNQIEIEISAHNNDGSKSDLYYSFEYQDLRLTNDSVQLEDELTTETIHSIKRNKNPFHLFDNSNNDASSTYSAAEGSQFGVVHRF